MYRVIGLASSCLPKFSPVPFTHCTINKVCNYASPSSGSYWLAAAEPTTSRPVRDTALRNYISRCSVCRAPFPVIAVHSQSNQKITCPKGFKELWTGYSFLMVFFSYQFLIGATFELRGNGV